MKLTIMQPYFFPYIGYFQLINAADKFVVYDNIQFTKKGWINRNRILANGKDEYISLPVKKDSDYLNVDQRKLAQSFKTERSKLLRRISESYRKAPQFSATFPLIESVINLEEENLFGFIYRSLQKVCEFLDIKTEFVVSSTLPVDHQLRSQEKILAICEALQATQYINLIGGMELYSKEIFQQHNIELKFLRSGMIEYAQFENEFVPGLSIIDVMMFNSKEQVKLYLQNNYTVI